MGLIESGQGDRKVMADFEGLKEQFRQAAMGLKGKSSVDQALQLLQIGLLFGVVELLMEIKEELANGNKSKDQA